MDSDSFKKWAKDYFAPAEVDISSAGDRSLEVIVKNATDPDLDVIDQLVSFEHEVQSIGWYVTYSEGIEDAADDVVYTVQSTEGRPVEVPRYVYHTTATSRVPSILNSGLKLSRGGSRHGFTYPPSVFFVREFGREADTQWKEDTTVLTIDTSKVPGLKLYADPQFDNGEDVDWVSAYARTSIPAEAISTRNVSESMDRLRLYVRMTARRLI